MAERADFFLGVDAGASRCKLRIRDAAGALVAEREAGPASPYAEGEKGFATLDAVIARGLAIADIGEDTLPFVSAGIASAGVSREEPARGFSAWRSPFGKTRFEVDIYAAWLGASGGEDGAVVSVGTGTAALAVRQGRRHFLSGYGFRLYDLGSAAWVGRRVLQGTLAAADGTRPPSGLTKRLMERFDGNPEQIALWAASATPAEFGGFAPWAVEAAARKDGVALTALCEAAADVDALIDRAQELGGGRVSLVGGFAGPLMPYLERRNRLSPAKADALEGAVMIARGEG
jgi:glucosamine kinase